MSTLTEEWKKYFAACHPPSQGEIPMLQEIETRQAFFAGALIAMNLIIKTGDLSDQDAESELEKMFAEAIEINSHRAAELLEGRN
jgi:hypothetical protein